MISAVVLTKNEEKNLERCLNSLKFCEEIIVVDDDSRDKTQEIAKKLDVNVFIRKLYDDFAGQRNFGLTKAKNDWVFFVDADEEVSPELTDEIRFWTNKNDEKYNGFYFSRKDFFLGKWLYHGETSGIKLIRLVRKEKGVWKRKVHEYLEVEGGIGVLKNPFFHYPHQTLSEFLRDLNYYSDLNAQVFISEKKETNVWEIISFPIGKFIQNYFLKRGFLDGTPGFIMAMMMSFHSFLTRVKIWQRQKHE